MNDIVSYSVSFRISDDSLDPHEITEMLGVTPCIAHRKGESNTSTTKKGRTIEYSPFSTGLWSLNSKLDAILDLNHHLESLLSILHPLKESLEKLSLRGYKMDMFCGVFANEAVFGFEIGHDALLTLGELKIKFGLCVYN